VRILSVKLGTYAFILINIAAAAVAAAAFQPASAVRAITAPLAITSLTVTGTRPLRTARCHGRRETGP